VVDLDENDAGREISVRAGEDIALRLTETPATGYRWHIEEQGGLAQRAADFTVDTAAGVGAAGRRVFHLSTVVLGTHVLRLRLRRPWEAPDRALRQFTCTVIVR